MCVQPSFIVGTYNEDGTYNFAPITWVSVTNEKDSYLIVISMYGSKMTKQNVLRTGKMSLNLVSTDMLELMDYLGSRHAKDGKKDALKYAVSKGEEVDVPCLDASRWVYECEVINSVNTGLSTTFFCQIKNIQISEDLVLNCSRGCFFISFVSPLPMQSGCRAVHLISALRFHTIR